MKPSYLIHGLAWEALSFKHSAVLGSHLSNFTIAMRGAAGGLLAIGMEGAPAGALCRPVGKSFPMGTPASEVARDIAEAAGLWLHAACTPCSLKAPLELVSVTAGEALNMLAGDRHCWTVDAGALVFLHDGGSQGSYDVGPDEVIFAAGSEGDAGGYLKLRKAFHLRVGMMLTAYTATAGRVAGRVDSVTHEVTQDGDAIASVILSDSFAAAAAKGADWRRPARARATV